MFHAGNFYASSGGIACPYQLRVKELLSFNYRQIPVFRNKPRLTKILPVANDRSNVCACHDGLPGSSGYRTRPISDRLGNSVRS